MWFSRNLSACDESIQITYLNIQNIIANCMSFDIIKGKVKD